MRKDSKEFLEKKYADPDPWGYQTNLDDLTRKQKIIAAAKFGSQRVYARYLASQFPDVVKPPSYPHYYRALDVGAGEGWISVDLPAVHIDAIEISDNAAARFPQNVNRVHNPNGGYDLMVFTGILYKHYDIRHLVKECLQYADGVVLTCNIQDSEIPFKMKPFYEAKFPYRGRVQRLAMYDYS